MDAMQDVRSVQPAFEPIYQSYAKQSGADVAHIYCTIPILGKVLLDGKHQTKIEIGDALNKQNITLDAIYLNMLIHFVGMKGILVNGRLNGNKQTHYSKVMAKN